MKTASLPIPGPVLGAYPERSAPERDVVARMLDALRARLPSSAKRYKMFADRVLAADAALGACGLQVLQVRLRDVRARMSRDGLADGLLVEAFALAGRAARLTLGQSPYATQIMAARVMLDGRLAEMATGEGKTLAAGLCAAVAALAGIPVHVITANDYLVTRDRALLQPLHQALGLSTGSVSQTLDSSGRRAAYACDITYCTAKELAFDYLRDQLSPPGRRLLRGLCMAVVDEADSVLIDEACVPLVISERRDNGAQRQYHRQALALAARLVPGADFTLDEAGMHASLTDSGRSRLEAETVGLESAWRNRLHRDETVATAIAALHLYHRDRHYLVRENAIAIIDETTGRLAAGRAWSRGLHQMIEIREGCLQSAETATAAQITYQRFFQRYLRLGGMSGTLRESRGELQEVYGLCMVTVPLRNPGRRKTLGVRLYPDSPAQWNAVVAQAVAVSKAGRPVLIGTDSVADSEQLSQHFEAQGIAHGLLNARQDGEEARVIAEAGHAGRITIATNMAGRGTDIALGAGVAERGGLHVICCQHNASRRIDRQLAGRCARQGDPGSVQTLLSTQQPLLVRGIAHHITRSLCATDGNAPQWLLALAIRLPQHFEEGRRRAQRHDLLKRDLRADRITPALRHQ